MAITILQNRSIFEAIVSVSVIYSFTRKNLIIFRSLTIHICCNICIGRISSHMWAISPPSFTRILPATYETNSSSICGSTFVNRRTETGLEECFGARKLPVIMHSKCDNLEDISYDCCPNTLRRAWENAKTYFSIWIPVTFLHKNNLNVRRDKYSIIRFINISITKFVWNCKLSVIECLQFHTLQNTIILYYSTTFKKLDVS